MFLSLAGSGLTLVGVLLGVWGTLLMCRAFHPYGTLTVVPDIFVLMWFYVTGRGDEARASLKQASAFAKVNEENGYRTLAGVYVLVFSFMVQMVGAALLVLDTMIRWKS